MSKFSTYAMNSPFTSYGYERGPSDHTNYRSEQRIHSSSNAQSGTIPFDGTSLQECDERGYRSLDSSRTTQEYIRRPEAQHSTSTNQLPPLSSIFAEPSFRDASRPNPYFHRSPTLSSMLQEHRAGLSPGYGDRTSWLQSNVSNTSHPGQSVRHQSSPQTELPPPPLVVGSLSRTSSTIEVQRTRYSPKQTSQASSPSDFWSSARGAPSGDCLSMTQANASSARPHNEGEQMFSASNYPREVETGTHYQVKSPESANTLPPQVKSSTSELSHKDGLGPKIWTGTQFLPRFVRQAEVAGEGMCYFYDDGSHCKTSIDGEAVNAHWGVTKAGKPRKRLAIACITCREKKIKCDPDYPKCVQCDKFGRVCKFKNAPRGGQGFLDNSPPLGAEDALPQHDGSDTDSLSRIEKSVRSTSPSTSRHPSPAMESLSGSRKRRKYNDDTSSVIPTHSHIFHNTSPLNSQWASVTSNKAKDSLQLKWPNNPYDVDTALVKELMQVYFSNIASTAYSFLPEQPFMEWLIAGGPKTSEDILLVYAVLAVATIWSSDPRASKLGVDFAKAARFASAGAFSLQIVQARQHFALYYESTGNLERSWDFLGSAIRAAIGSGLHLELPNDSNLDISVLPLGLNRGSYAETRRRTFWSCYIMDRLGSFQGSGRLSNISMENIFLRMPCDNASFKQQKELVNPFFCPDLDLTYNQAGTFGIMAYLVLVCTIYHDIMAKIWRAEQGQKIANVETFYQDMETRLDNFIKSLPPCITHSIDNVNKTTEFGLLGSFAAVHAVYRAAMVKLHTSPALEVPGLIGTSDRQRSATKQAQALIRETGHLSRRYNRAVGVNEYACGHIPSFIGTAVTDAMRLLDKEREISSAKVEDAQEVIEGLCMIWPGILTSTR